MQGQRIVELAYNNDFGIPVYVVNRRDVHDAVSLARFGDFVDHQQDVEQFVTVTPEFTLQFRTRPLYLSFEEGSALLESGPLRIVWSSVRDPHSQPIRSRHFIKLPDLTQPELVELPFSPFNREEARMIDNLIDEVEEPSLQNSQSIAQRLGVPYLRPQLERLQVLPTVVLGSSQDWRPTGTSSPSPRREASSQENPILEALIARLYGLPVTPPQALIVNGLPVPLVPFEQAVQMLQRDEVERYTIDPLNQVWAGPPGTPNRIVTLIRRDGILSAVLAKYDPSTGQIYRPN